MKKKSANFPNRWEHFGMVYQIHTGIKTPGNPNSKGWGFRIERLRVFVSQGLANKDMAHEVAQNIIERKDP